MRAGSSEGAAGGTSVLWQRQAGRVPQARGGRTGQLLRPRRCRLLPSRLAAALQAAVSERRAAAAAHRRPRGRLQGPRRLARRCRTRRCRSAPQWRCLRCCHRRAWRLHQTLHKFLCRRAAGGVGGGALCHQVRHLQQQWMGQACSRRGQPINTINQSVTGHGEPAGVHGVGAVHQCGCCRPAGLCPAGPLTNWARASWWCALWVAVHPPP